MKNLLIGILTAISILSLGYITYDKFVRSSENCSQKGEEYISATEEYFTKLEIYDFANIKSINVTINGKNVKVENRDDILYINDKKIESDSSRIYVTDYYIFTVCIAQSGVRLRSAIDENGNVTNLDNNEIIGDFQAYIVSLSEGGSLVAVGRDFCGLDCDSGYKTVEISYSNKKLHIEKRNSDY